MCQINPMSEFRAIIDTEQKTCLPRDARHLWQILFACANERQKRNPATGAWEWPEGFFPVSVDELKLKSAMEKRAILKARGTLKEMGFIDFIPGKNDRKPAMYKLHYLTECRYKSVPALVPAVAPLPAPVPVPQVVPIYKDIDIEKDKENTVRDDDDVFGRIQETCARVREWIPTYEADRTESPEMREYREFDIRRSFIYAFGREPKRPELERLVNSSRRLNFSPVMVLMALTRAARYDADSPTEYAISMLKYWHEHNYREPAQIDMDWADTLKANEKYWEERDCREECGT